MTPVVAALIWNESGQVLICQRPKHKARALLWEFPGGKVEQGERHEQALIRECMEELGIVLQVGALYQTLTHTYPDLTVQLYLYHARIKKGAPQALEHAAITWKNPTELDSSVFCPADKSIIEQMSKGVSPDFN